MRGTEQWRLMAGAAALALGVVAVSAPAWAQQAAGPAPSPAPVPHFFIKAFQVKGNHILAPTEVEDAVYPFMGPDKTPTDVEHARAALQAIFQQKGYPTVSVFIPEQSVDSGIIQLEVQAQTIGQVTVTGGTRTPKSWLMARAPSLAPGTAPNFQDVQRDIVALNQSADRRVTPDVKAGVAPGTVDVNLKVEDDLPLHGSLEFNNDQSPSTTPYRVLGTLRYDDLWGRGDSLSVSAQTAPEKTKDATVFSGNYLARVGPVQLLGYYVHSDSDVAVVGGTSVVGKGDEAGVRVIVPISQSTNFYQSITAGIDWKDFGEVTRFGSTPSSTPVTYFPVTLGWRGDWTGKSFKSDVSLSGVLGLRGAGDGLLAFDAKRYQAKPDFFALKLDATHTQDVTYAGLGGVLQGVQLWGHLTGQWSADPLISNEEFSLGGLSTVRGYQESEALGDYGLAGQVELRTPNFTRWTGDQVLQELRLHLFADGGWTGIHDPLQGQVQGSWLGSAGVGAGFRILKHVNGAVDVGVPLVSGPNTKADSVFNRFRIWGDF